MEDAIDPVSRRLNGIQVCQVGRNEGFAFTEVGDGNDVGQAQIIDAFKFLAQKGANAAGGAR